MYINTIKLLKNPIQEYKWGSCTAIPELMGKQSPSDRPQAELWMGAHPKASSIICLDEVDGRRIHLNELIEQYPEDILGKEVAARFNNKLPYLFKILAAAKPLSLQAHPSAKQAREGFARENKKKIPLNAPNRNYKDNSHKPECICALTPFWALNGFRKVSDIVSLMKKICPAGLTDQFDNLRKHTDPAGLKSFFKNLLSLDMKLKMKIISDTILNVQRLSDDNPVFKWLIKLYEEYPADVGIFSPILLNLVCLEPGQAMFLPAGELHAYLDGTGIELMANSDNVLRGGLTSKHIDVPEPFKALNFEERKIDILLPQKSKNCESVYLSRANEFILSVISVNKNGKEYKSHAHRSVEIILCTDGEAIITDINLDNTIALSGGASVIVPAAADKYSIRGNATLYKAAVPI